MNTQSSDNKEQRETTNNRAPRDDIAASSRFMPQSGKPAGIYNTQEDDSERGETHGEPPGEKVAASNRFMPQSGKRTGTSSI